MISRKIVSFHEWVDVTIILGVLGALVGTYWDIQYHIDVGRDSFWIAPHKLVYGSLGLVLLAAVYAVMQARRLPKVRATQSIFVATMCILGSVTAFFLGAPFDELWHRLYGLDVTVWSPPHLYLIAAGFGIVLSLIYFQRLYLSISRQARSRHVTLDELGLEFMCALGIVALNIIFAEFEFFQEIIDFTFFHLKLPWIYLLGMTVVFSFTLSLAKQITSMRWAATRIGFFYFLLRSLFTVGLIAFANGISYPMLPALAFIPALAFDLLYRRDSFLRIVLAAAAFAAVFYAIQTAAFFLGGIPKYIPASSVEVAVAILFAIVAALIGAGIGRLMQRQLSR